MAFRHFRVKTSVEIIRKAQWNAEQGIDVPNFRRTFDENDDVIIPYDGFLATCALVPHGNFAFGVRDKNDVTFSIGEEWFLAKMPRVFLAIIGLSFERNGRVVRGRGAVMAFHEESFEVGR